MGVRGLQSFAEKCPTVFRSVDVRQMVADYRKAHPEVKSDPVIVVDGLNCLHFWIKHLEWVHGGQWDEYMKVLDDFLEAFRRIGVKLVFFFDGLVPRGKQEEWLARHRCQVESIQSIFERIKASEPLDPDMFIFPAGLTNVIPLALKYIFHATVFCCVDGECDRTLASYAAYHRCLAILAQDTDYIIFPTIPYISMKHLDMKTMTTRTYCRQALCRELGLQGWMLPLFACMVGTDFISRDGLAEFHKKICAKRYKRGVPRIHIIVRCVAEYIAKYNIVSQKELMRRLPEIHASLDAENVISLEVFQKGMDEYTVLLTGNGGYFLPATDQEDVRNGDVIYDVLLRKVRNAEVIPLILNVIWYGRTVHSPSMEDMNAETQILPRVLVYRPITQRMYALIFELKDNYFNKSMIVPYTGDTSPTQNTVEEMWINPSKNSSNDKDIVSPLPVNLPDGLSNTTILYDIIMAKCDDEPNTKWAIFMACTKITISRATFEEVSHKHKSMCAILNYLITVPGMSLKIWEIEAFIIQAIHPKFKDYEWQKKLQVVFSLIEPYDSRAVHLAALFLGGADKLLELLRFCGIPIEIENFIPCNFFNGRLFQYTYKNMESNDKVGLNSEKRKLFQQIRDAVFEGVDIQKCIS